MKKLFSLISVLAVAGLGVGLLAACSEKEEEVPSDDTTTEPEHTHSYTGVVTTPASCTEDGLMTYTCECGDYYTVDIPATGHTWGNAVYSVVDTEVVWTRTCEVCGAVETLSHEELADLEEAPVLEASSEDALTAGLTVDGATVVIPAGEDGEASVAVSKSLTIAPASEEETIDVTIVIDDGAALGVDSESDLTSGSSTNNSTPGLIDVQKGASLTLELGEGSSVTGASGDAYESTSQNAYHDGLISVGEGGSIVINADNSSDVTQTNPYGAVINIDTGGSCEINGGRYSVEGAKEYTVVNDGDMVINDGVFVTTNTGSSLIINGDDHDTAGHEDHDHSLVINGGEFYGGKHVVKNSLHGYLEINDGVFDGFLGEYDGTSVDPSDDLLDNEDATTVINGGVFGEGNAEMETEGETGNYKVTITVKGGHAATDTPADDGYTSTVTINGGTFYKGQTALFAFGDTRDVKDEAPSAYDQIHILSSVYSEISELVGEGAHVHEPTSEYDYYVLEGASEEGEES